VFSRDFKGCGVPVSKVLRRDKVSVAADNRKDLSEILGRLDASRNIDVKVMLVALTTTMDFEAKLDLRFGIRDMTTIDYSVDHVIDPSSSFYRIIASCFVPYLEHYIQSEDLTLSVMIDDLQSMNVVDSVDADGLLTSATDLFHSYRQTMIQFARFSTSKPFLDLGKMFAKHLSSYSALLISKLPIVTSAGINETDVKIFAIIINTGDYCASMVSQLEEKFSERINEQFCSLVNFANERQEFLKYASIFKRTVLLELE
jgi:hypothetical protein